jgi:hypothetical protein
MIQDHVFDGSHEHPSLVPQKRCIHDGKICMQDGRCAHYAERVHQELLWLKHQYQLNDLESAGFLAVVMTRPALEHRIFKELSGFVMHTEAWFSNNVHV